MGLWSGLLLDLAWSTAIFHQMSELDVRLWYLNRAGPDLALVCAHSHPPFERCTSQHHLPPRSWLDSPTNHLPPAPCWLVTSGAAAGPGNSWTSSRSHLSATSSVRICLPPWSLVFCTCTATRQSVLPSWFDISICSPPFLSYSSTFPPSAHSWAFPPLHLGHYSPIISLISCWLDLFFNNPIIGSGRPLGRHQERRKHQGHTKNKKVRPEGL